MHCLGYISHLTIIKDDVLGFYEIWELRVLISQLVEFNAIMLFCPLQTTETNLHSHKPHTKNSPN